jgi:hypothetical protein
MPRKLYLSFFLDLLFSSVFDQPGKDKYEVEIYFSEALKGNSYCIYEDCIGNVSPVKLLQSKSLCLVSETSFLRYPTIDLITHPGILPVTGNERAKYIYVLCEVYKSDYSGVCSASSKALVKFNRSDVCSYFLIRSTNYKTNINLFSLYILNAKN